MSAGIVFIIGLAVVGIFYFIYSIVDRICQYKERVSENERKESKKK